MLEDTCTLLGFSGPCSLPAAPATQLGHCGALTPNAVAPGQQRQAQHRVAQLEDDAQGPQDVHQLRGRGVDPHGAGQEAEEGKHLAGGGEAGYWVHPFWPAVSLLGTPGTGKVLRSHSSQQSCSGPWCAFGAGDTLRSGTWAAPR